MIPVTIQLKTDDSLNYNNQGKLQVHISNRGNNRLEILNDGLYAEAKPGEPGSTGTGYPDRYRSANGVESGTTSPDDSTLVTKRIVGPSIMHRIFTCENTDGSDIVLRSVDYMYAGDMYRVEDLTNNMYHYYVITSVAADGKAVATHSEIVASIPLANTHIN